MGLLAGVKVFMVGRAPYHDPSLQPAIPFSLRPASIHESCLRFPCYWPRSARSSHTAKEECSSLLMRQTQTLGDSLTRRSRDSDSPLMHLVTFAPLCPGVRSGRWARTTFGPLHSSLP